MMGVRWDECPEFGVGTLMQIVPQINIIPLRVNPHTPFKTKNSFFPVRGRTFPGRPHYSPPPKPSGSASVSPIIPTTFTPMPKEKRTVNIMKKNCKKTVKHHRTVCQIISNQVICLTEFLGFEKREHFESLLLLCCLLYH